MHSFTLVLVLLALLGVVCADTKTRHSIHDFFDSHIIDHLTEYASYLKEYQKVYTNDEIQTRFSYFTANLDFIESHNKRFNSGLESYSVGLNQFADWSKEEYLAYLTASPKHKPTKLEQLSDITSVQKVSPINALPTEVDWRLLGLVTDVKDQGGCGSCWTFSATGAMEGAWGLKYGNSSLVVLSEQEYIDCLQGGTGCGGGWPRWVFQYVIDNGADSESNYPYKGIDGPKCLYNKSAAVARLSSYVNITRGDELALTSAAASIPGVSVCIDASRSGFSLYKSGVYQDSQCKKDEDNLDHAVLVVGYGHDAATNLDYYLVKNSWGPKWGDLGYIKMFRDTTGGTNNCGIATVAAYAIAA